MRRVLWRYSAAGALLQRYVFCATIQGMSDLSPSRITIALCTYNGAHHLEAQLDSYLAQSYTQWDLWISDDGSQDATRVLLDDFSRKYGAGRDIRIIKGPCAGVAENFLSLLCHPEFPTQTCALSDQDDVWLPEKLALGMVGIEDDMPCLYGAQSIHTDASLNPIGSSIGKGRPSFGNALVQNIVSGHSTMLNASALALVRAAGVPQGIPYHDWWLYQLITGAGGRVVVRSDRVLLYRQHDANAMGSHQGLRANFTRLSQMFGRTYGGWIASNNAALRAVPHVLTPAARATLAALAQAPPRVCALARLRILYRHRIARQGLLGTVLLYLAVLLGRS